MTHTFSRNNSKSTGTPSSANRRQPSVARSPGWERPPAPLSHSGGETDSGGAIAGILAPKELASEGKGKAFGVEKGADGGNRGEIEDVKTSTVDLQVEEERENQPERDDMPSFVILDCSKVTNVSEETTVPSSVKDNICVADLLLACLCRDACDVHTSTWC